METYHHDKTMPHGAKFIRRTDLPPLMRLYIGVTALLAQRKAVWGTITALAREFVISRTFVYMLAYQVAQAGEDLFGQPPSVSSVRKTPTKRLAYQYMVSLRLEGCCSIGAIATIMKRFQRDLSSTGKISQTLQHMGALVPNTLSVPEGRVQMLVVFASDELFAHKLPILVTAEPVSSALLRLELVTQAQWTAWQQHWECLEDNGYYALYLVSDGGQALSKAQKETLKDRVRQPDTYHAIAHRLGGLVRRLEREAYRAIEQEEEAQRLLRQAATKKQRQQTRTTMTHAARRAAEKIARYEDVRYLYHCLVEELRLFDEVGQMRGQQEAAGNIEAALDLLEELGIDRITEVVQSIRRTLPDLLHYFDQARFVVASLDTWPLEPETLHALCLAWQWHKHRITAKTPKARRYCAAQEQIALNTALVVLSDDFETWKAQVYRQLDQIVRSSSMVECLNSIIRPYLDTTHNHVTQELLNLILFYHNHRRYQAGERKGRTPMELLSGTPQDKDWLVLLFEEIEKKQPNFFATSR